MYLVKNPIARPSVSSSIDNGMSTMSSRSMNVLVLLAPCIVMVSIVDTIMLVVVVITYGTEKG
ncbi:hypothetical protein [Desulfurococcus sp.]|uniref:hypothetical protein n=1 Tax=Desulfurococcus sp. TaxID=51678 RepID=UPI00317373B3